MIARLTEDNVGKIQPKVYITNKEASGIEDLTSACV